MITFLDLGGYGRLGNQMFQIASTMGIARANKHACIFPRWEYSGRFKCAIPQEKREWLHDYDWQLCEEPTTGYNDVVLDPNQDWNLHGYFQSWRYFEILRDSLQDLYFAFQGDTTPLPYTSIHIRRGDYEQRRDTHPDLWPDYYDAAMQILGGPFMVFSDDVSWCHDRFRYLVNKVVICTIKDPIDAIWIMSRCQDNIIANSSFSWWAAYLNRNLDKRVIAPNNYVVGETSDDRLPPEWIRV